MAEVSEAGLLPCCNWLWSVDDLGGRPCVGVMHMSWPEYVCNACGGRCGAIVHPDCHPSEQAATTHPSASAGLAGNEGERDE